MLTDLSPDLLRPGAWIDVAQDALDRCSLATTVDDVVREFGSARALAEAVLGFPVAGGFATKPVIRSVGRLVTHRLGPAVAAEALSWAASICEVIDCTTIEAFLELAVDAPTTFRPRQLADREELQQLLLAERTPKARRARLFELWDRSQYEGDDLSFWNPELRHCELFGSRIDALVGSWDFELGDWATGPMVPGSLFDESDEVIAQHLVEHTNAVLAHPSCPAALRRLIRNPYDEATFELALRAGPAHVAPDRLRVRLERLDDEALSDLGARIPAQLLFALRSIGAVTADLLLTGPLRHVDLGAPDVITAAFGGYGDWPSQRMPAELVRLLEEHPQREVFTRWLEVCDRGVIDDEVALRLVATGPPPLALAALRHVSSESLTTEHAARFGGDIPYTVKARCPGLAAIDRCDHGAVFNFAWGRPAPAPTRFHYAPEIQALETASFAEAPGWTITLPRTPKDLERNAAYMHNCTRGLVQNISEEWYALLIVYAPDGHRYNASLVKSKSTWSVGEINGRDNDGDEPTWLRPALHARLHAVAPSADPVDDVRPAAPHRATERRDRRRRRASAARLRRR